MHLHMLISIKLYNNIDNDLRKIIGKSLKSKKFLVSDNKTSLYGITTIKSNANILDI